MRLVLKVVTCAFVQTFEQLGPGFFLWHVGNQFLHNFEGALLVNHSGGCRFKHQSKGFWLELFGNCFELRAGYRLERLLVHFDIFALYNWNLLLFFFFFELQLILDLDVFK